MLIRKDFLLQQEGIFTRRNWLICFIFGVGLFVAYLNVEVSDTPFQRLFVSGEEHIKPVSFDGAASVENFHGPAVAIAGDEHFSAEGIPSVCRHKGIARPYLVPAGRYSVRIFTAAFRTGTIGRYTHFYAFPFFGLLGITLCITLGISLGIISLLVCGIIRFCLDLFHLLRFSTGRLSAGLGLYFGFIRNRAVSALYITYSGVEQNYRTVTLCARPVRNIAFSLLIRVSRFSNGASYPRFHGDKFTPAKAGGY